MITSVLLKYLNLDLSNAYTKLFDNGSQIAPHNGLIIEGICAKVLI